MSRIHKKCCISTCRDRARQKSFHELPSELKLRQKWLNYMSALGTITAGQYSTICNLHFESNAFKVMDSGKRRLKNGAVPTIFSDNSSGSQDPVATYKLPCVPKKSVHIKITPTYRNFTVRDPLAINSPPCKPKKIMHLRMKPVQRDSAVQVKMMPVEDVAKMKQEIKMLKRKVKRLSKYNEQKNFKLQELQTRLDSELSHCRLVQNIIDDAEDDDPAAILLLDQVVNYKLGKPRWSDITLKMCTLWQTSTPKGYNYCSNLLFKLPSRSTLQRHSGKEQDMTETESIEIRLDDETSQCESEQQTLLQ